MKIEGTGSNFPIKPESLIQQADQLKAATPQTGDSFQKSGDTQLSDLIKQARTFQSNQVSSKPVSSSKGGGKGTPVNSGSSQPVNSNKPVNSGKGTPSSHK